MSSSIVVVGSINADLTVNVHRHPAPGETLLGAGGRISAGGKGANQALAAARLGTDVALVGAVGRDANAAPATELLRDGGVDMSAVAETDEVTGLAVITVSADAENTIVVVPGANSLVDDTYVSSHAPEVRGAGLVLLQGEIPASGFAKAVELAQGRVVINLAPVVEVPREALLKADPLLVNEHEAGLVLDMLGADGAQGSPEEMVRGLREAGFVSVVLTLGAAGALVADAEGETSIPAVKVSAVDSVGAGDAFAGALCHRLVSGDSLVEAARFASRVGAFAVTRAGAQASYPSLSDELPG